MTRDSWIFEITRDFEILDIENQSKSFKREQEKHDCP